MPEAGLKPAAGSNDEVLVNEIGGKKNGHIRGLEAELPCLVEALSRL